MSVSHPSEEAYNVVVDSQTGRTNKILRPPQRNGWLRSHMAQTYLSAPAADLIEAGASFEVKVDLSLSGASRLGISPFAMSTDVALSSDWADPGFSGGFPPKEREISEAGFSADWSVPYLRRGIRAHGKAHSLTALTSPSN